MSSKKTVLITRPAFDEPTHYLSAWSQSITDTAKAKGFDVIELNKDAQRTVLETYLKKKNPRLIAFHGHGTDDAIFGYKNEVLVKVGENEATLNNRVVCSFSCNSAKTLGPKSIEAGATAFVGFSEKFVLLHEERFSATPKRDKTAAHFLEPVNLVPISLLKGSSVGEAYQKSQAAFDKSIEYFETHYTPENSHILLWLRYDKMIQQAHGEQTASL